MYMIRIYKLTKVKQLEYMKKGMGTLLLSRCIRISTNCSKINMKLYETAKQFKPQQQRQQLWCSLSSKLHKDSVNGKVALSSNNQPIKPHEGYDVQEQQEKWQAIYHFQLIGLISAYNRLKISYGLFNVIAIPTIFAVGHMTQLPPTYTTLVTAIGLTSWLTLVFSSLFARNLIGFIYINDAADKMKLAFVDYWGKRHDRILSLDDVKIQPSKLLFYKTLYFRDDKYTLLHRHGTFLDHYIFAGILDHIEE